MCEGSSIGDAEQVVGTDADRRAVADHIPAVISHGPGPRQQGAVRETLRRLEDDVGWLIEELRRDGHIVRFHPVEELVVAVPVGEGRRDIGPADEPGRSGIAADTGDHGDAAGCVEADCGQRVGINGRAVGETDGDRGDGIRPKRLAAGG